MTGSRPEKKATKILEFLYSEFFSLHIKETLLPFNFFIMPLISIFDTFANLERAIFACTMFKNLISTKLFKMRAKRATKCLKQLLAFWRRDFISNPQIFSTYIKLSSHLHDVSKDVNFCSSQGDFRSNFSQNFFFFRRKVDRVDFVFVVVVFCSTANCEGRWTKFDEED